MNCRVLAESAEPGKKLFPPFVLARLSRKNHDDLRVHHLCKVFDLTVATRPIDSTHGCGGTVALG
jgi:hypothetical protein